MSYDGYVPVSFLQAKGAMDVGIEFHSLSKSYNMTGWRIGMAVGNPRIIDALMRVKSNIDSGIAAGDPAHGDRRARRPAGRHRRAQRHLPAPPRQGRRRAPQARPAGDAAEGQPLRLGEGARRHDVRAEFAERLLDEAAVIVTPGNGYGAHGEGYVRLSLTLPDDRVDEGLRRIAAVPALA